MFCYLKRKFCQVERLFCYLTSMLFDLKRCSVRWSVCSVVLHRCYSIWSAVLLSYIDVIRSA